MPLGGIVAQAIGPVFDFADDLFLTNEERQVLAQGQYALDNERFSLETDRQRLMLLANSKDQIMIGVVILAFVISAALIIRN